MTKINYSSHSLNIPVVIWFVSLRMSIGVPSCCLTVEQMLYLSYGHSIQPARNALVGIMLIVIANKAKTAISIIMNGVLQQQEQRAGQFFLALSFTGRMY